MKRKPSSFFVPPRGRTFNEVMWSNENVFTDDSSQKVEDESTSPDTSTRNVDTTDSNSGTEESESDNSKGTSKRMWHIPFVLLLFMSAILAGVLVVFWHGQQQHEGYTPKSLDLLTHDHHINLKAGLEGGSAGYGGPRDQRIDEDSYAPETADEVTATTTEVTEEDVEDLTAPEQTIRKSTRTKIHTPLATTDVVLSVSKRSKKAKKHTTTTAGAPTTTDNAVPVPVRPIIRRPLLCTIGRYARASTKYPEDGLCDFLFCPVALQENLQFNSESDAFQGFRAQAARSRKTQFGLDINVREMNATLARLSTDQGTSAFKSLWDGNVRQHGVFYPALRHNTDPAYVNMIIRLLKALRRLQLKFRTTDEVLPSHIFVGIALLLRGQDRDAGVKKHFNKIISVVKPDVILLRTHYLKKDDGNLLKCRITGPTVWQGSFSADQPTFLESLRFLQKVTIPNQAVVLLSFTEAIRWYRWDANDTTFNLGEKCAIDFHSDLVHRSKLCLNTATNKQVFTAKHKSTQQVVTALNKKSFGLVYDTRDTIRTKMCWASTSFKYAVGWAMFDLEFADTANICKDAVFTKGFPLVRWMRHYIKNGFHEASECEA